MKPLVRRKFPPADFEPVHESGPANNRGTILTAQSGVRANEGNGSAGRRSWRMLPVEHIGACLAQSRAASPYAEIYQRATNEFAQALFYKPAEPKAPDLPFSLAPLILQEVNDAKEPLSLPDRFGTLSVSNGAPVLDRSRPAIYWEADTVQIRGTALARFSYVWCYAPGSPESKLGQGIKSAVPGQAEPGLALQGIRITLNSAGQPGIWEVLADSSRAKLFFVSQNLEAAAMAEFGQPLPGRRFATERSWRQLPM